MDCYDSKLIAEHSERLGNEAEECSFYESWLANEINQCPKWLANFIEELITNEDIDLNKSIKEAYENYVNSLNEP